MEIWKDIKDYEGIYQVSNYGRIKSLKRLIVTDKKNYRVKEKLIGSNNYDGYISVGLSKKGKTKHFKLHSLVAMAFLGHKPDGYNKVVNHKDLNKKNNHIDNLEIVNQRYNSNAKHLKSTSKYIGVSWSKKSKKWTSAITVKSKSYYLGRFDKEKDAREIYLKAVKKIENGYIVTTAVSLRNILSNI